MAQPKKYGLIIKKKTADLKVKKASIFGGDSSDEEKDNSRGNVNISLAREATKKKQMKQTQIEIKKALEEDPTVYEYDAIYDDMEEKKKAAVPTLTQKDKKAKYIENLLKSAAARKREDERRIERQVQKEREDEGSEFRDKEEFVTSAYRKKMLEQAEEEERLKKQDKIDSMNDVTKRSDLSMFYRDLLTKNVSMGGSFAADSDKPVEKAGKEKTGKEKAGKEKFEIEKIEVEKFEVEKIEVEKIEVEKIEVEKIEIEKIEVEKIEVEKVGQDGGSGDREPEDREKTRQDSDRYPRQEDGECPKYSSSSDKRSRRPEDDRHARSSSGSHRRRHEESRKDEDSSDKSRRDSHRRRETKEKKHLDDQEPGRAHKEREHSDHKKRTRRESEEGRDEVHKNLKESQPLRVEENDSSSHRDTETKGKESKESKEQEKQNKFAKRSSNETVKTAKERYLERKRARELAKQTRPVVEDSDED